MSRSTHVLPARHRRPRAVVPIVTCDACATCRVVLDATDLPHDWAARVGPDQQVRHYCGPCDPGPAPGAGARPVTGRGYVSRAHTEHSGPLPVDIGGFSGPGFTTAVHLPRPRVPGLPTRYGWGECSRGRPRRGSPWKGDWISRPRPGGGAARERGGTRRKCEEEMAALGLTAPSEVTRHHRRAGRRIASGLAAPLQGA